MAARATSLLREHQTEYGAWLTAHTASPRYQAPQPELNTFLTSTLVDLLSPLAHDRKASILRCERARVHISPRRSKAMDWCATTGCRTDPRSARWAAPSHRTPTTRRWCGGSPAPAPSDPRRQPMLDVLARYRDARGFYRTWLAPRKGYRCLDPGSDPNPTDIAIQLHVYLMLRELDPPAAQALCGNLQRSFHDEDIWVYYAKSALLPYLRVAELAQRGCALPLPVERLALPVAGQAIWSETMHTLVEITASPGNIQAQQTARRVLAQLRANDFALLRTSPPLLYHNDLSATVRRYYWSEDVGYALWLRLHEAAGIDTEPAPLRAP